MAIQTNPVLNQSLTVSKYPSHLRLCSLVERLDKLNGLGPLPLRWFLTHQEKNHGPPQAAHIVTRLLQPWPGVTDSPKWFLYRPPRWCPRHLLRSFKVFQMLNREWGVKSNGKLPHLFIYNYKYYNIIINVLPKGRSFTANSGTRAAILPKGRSSIANLGT